MARVPGEAFKRNLAVSHCGLGTLDTPCDGVAIGTAFGLPICGRHAQLLQEVAVTAGGFWRATPFRRKRAKQGEDQPERASKKTKKAG